MRVFRASCVAALVLAACAAAAPAAPSSQSEVRLPRVWPQHLAPAPDGSIWAAGAYGGVTRVDPSGSAKTFGIGRFNWAYDLVAGPDGAIWMATDDGIRRIDAAGRQTRWALPRGAWPQAIASAGGALWVADAANPDRIDRVATDGVQETFRIAPPRKAAVMTGIAAGPDGALWFTQSGFFGDPPDGIGRMTTTGQSTSWALPHPRANPTRIAAGPDGALWFTELEGHAVGRITPSGSISEFPLPAGLDPYDIAAGPDGAMWFTADSCIGRITTSGQVMAWPVHGAGRLLGIVAAPDGSIWGADDIKSALWRFTPPADGAPPPTPCAPPTITRQARRTQASLVYRREGTFRHTDWFSDPRIRISRDGKLLLAETVPRIDRHFDVLGETSSFAVRDLDGDREPEVMLELNLGGPHCCAWTRVYRYARSSGRYRAVVHFWGDDAASPRVRDLNHDGKPEFVSVDARFAYAFAPYAGSFFPIQIWSYRHGRFRDVSRRFPRPVGRDAASLWRRYVHLRRKRDETARGILPAWAADEYLLGRGAAVWTALEHAAAEGYLGCPRGGCAFSPSDPQAYIRKVRAFLRKNGYLR